MSALLLRFVSSIVLTLATVGCNGASTTPPPSAPTTTASTKADPDYERLCAGVPSAQQAMCPMGAWAQSIEDVEGGVLLHLNGSAPSPEETQRRMRCHRAWMAHDPSNTMPRCPLGSPGIDIHAKAGATGTDLTLTATKAEDVQEVRRRTHAALAK